MDWFQDQMRKGMNPRTYALVAALLLVLAWIHSLDVSRKQLRGRNQAGRVALPAPAPRVDGRGTQASFAPTPTGWGRDPFERRVFDSGEQAGKARPAPRETTTPAIVGLYLQGIMNGPMGRTALINGEICREGQRIGTREVIQIGRRSVMILDEGSVMTLTLKGEG